MNATTASTPNVAIPTYGPIEDPMDEDGAAGAEAFAEGPVVGPWVPVVEQDIAQKDKTSAKQLAAKARFDMVTSFWIRDWLMVRNEPPPDIDIIFTAHFPAR